MRLLPLFLLPALACFFPPVLEPPVYEPGEGEPGLVTGRVTDGESCEYLIGATVTIWSGAHGAYSDEQGLYSFSVPPGRYTVEAGLPGYAMQRRVIKVPPGDTLIVDFVLERGPPPERDIN
jgi:protocatechuate 3,4-dioxygenase beta subunit